MSNVAAKKVFIKIESAETQQENIKNQRKSLRVLQNTATDKENLTGRPILDKLGRIKTSSDSKLASTEYNKRKKVETKSVETQTSDEIASTDIKTITAEDLTSSSKPSENYWEHLAEKRRDALEKTLEENQKLHERIEGLEEELNTTRQLLDESKNLVEVLKDIINENENEDKGDAASSYTETSSDVAAEDDTIVGKDQ